MPRKIGPLLALALAAAALLFGAYALSRPQPAYSLTHIERADTPEAREQGLSGRADVPAGYGMLFVFPKAGKYGFWMKDMLVPIDIIWLSDTFAVLGVEDSVATSTYPQTFYPPAPARYVLETRAGTAREEGWREGTTLRLPP